ncbi:hypothetical protein, partial [Stutzerimonas nitrititolerans]|uniref:hypothetical protein n=1 Tax=Stutzerimonas nitrititolerans TaxID=2482751 RepID=UPI0028A922B7
QITTVGAVMYFSCAMEAFVIAERERNNGDRLKDDRAGVCEFRSVMGGQRCSTFGQLKAEAGAVIVSKLSVS